MYSLFSRLITRIHAMHNSTSIRGQQGFINREIVIAITLGFAIGLVVTYGIWTANHSLKQQQVASPSGNNTSSESTISVNVDDSESPDQTASTGNNGSEFTVMQPQLYTLTDQATYTISGFVPNDQTIIVLSESGQTTVTPEKDGEYIAEIKLITGVNYITIFAVDSQGKSQRIDRTIVLST